MITKTEILGLRMPDNLLWQINEKIRETEAKKQQEYGQKDETLALMAEVTNLTIEKCIEVLVSKHLVALFRNTKSNVLTEAEVVEKWVDILIYRKLQKMYV